MIWWSAPTGCIQRFAAPWCSVHSMTSSDHWTTASRLSSAQGYRPREEDVYVIHNTPGRLLARFALRDDKTLFLFVFAHDAAGGTTRLGYCLAEDATAKSIPRQWLGERRNSRGSGGTSMTFTSIASARFTCHVVTRTCRACRRCRILPIADGRPRLGLGHDGGLCPRWRVGRTGGSHEDAFRQYESSCDPTSRPSKEAPRILAARFHRGPPGFFVRNLIIAATAIPGWRDWPLVETSSIDLHFPNIFGIDPFDAGASTEIGYLFYLKNGGTLEKAAQMANHVHARDAALRPAGGGSHSRRARGGADFKRRAPGIGSAKQFPIAGVPGFL